MLLHLPCKYLIFAFIILNLSNHVHSWESYELDLFDLVDEVGENFYKVFEIEQNADASEIRKAYRKLSLKWHPDRNTEPGAEEKFRKIVSINEVLKDEEKRKRYDKILEFGLPDWRQPIYYYRRVRKLNIVELALMISVIVIIGHYFVMWAQYFEKRLCLDERLSETRKKIEKKEKKKNKNANMEAIDKNLQHIYDLLEKPKLKETIPIRLVMWLYNNKLFIPLAIEMLKPKAKKDEDEGPSEEEIREMKRLERLEEMEKTRRERVKDLNPTKVEMATFQAPKLYDDAAISAQSGESSTDESKNSVKNRKVWDDEDQAALIKAIAKFPGGTNDRWTMISRFVGKPVEQCIQMEKSLKSNYQKVSSVASVASALQNKTTNGDALISDEVMTKRDEFEESGDTASSAWSQEQQKQLENALKQVDKNALDRWERIAELVPGKTKEACIQRFKSLCQAVNKSKTK